MELREAVLLVVVVACVVSAGKHDIYSRHSVHGIQLRDRSDLELLHALEQELNLDVWQHGAAKLRDAMVMVSPDNSDAFFEALDESGMTHYLHISDVAEAFEEYDVQVSRSKASRQNRMLFQDHPRYAEIDAYLDSLANQYPNLVSVVNAGLSYEGRNVKYLKISTTNFTDTSKPIYFMEAMIHAREWVTTPVALYSIYRLVENLRAEEQDLLDNVDWIILPLLNPDGYEYTHTDERLWRKTRSILNVSTTCIGVDGNRNFDYAFNTIGVSSDPCATTYPGHEAFSEPETGYTRDILFEYLDRIQIFMDIHSYGNYILFGYGNDMLLSNVAQLHYVGAAMGAAIDAAKLPEARYYLVGNSGMVLYGTSGSAQDYGQFVGVPFSFTLELPGYDYDFRVPLEYQEQINEETWAGIVESARLSSLYYRSRYTAANTTSTPTTTSTTTTTSAPTTTTSTTTTTTSAPTTTTLAPTTTTLAPTTTTSAPTTTTSAPTTTTSTTTTTTATPTTTTTTTTSTTSPLN